MVTMLRHSNFYFLSKFFCLLSASQTTVTTTLALSSLRIFSWNLLAPLYASRSKYPWSHPSHLQWEYRKDRIAQQILQADADLVCLQEVQLDCWESLYRHNVTTGVPTLSTSSTSSLYTHYDCVLQNVTRGHQIVVALLVCRTSGWNVDVVESRSRALLAVLRNPHHNNPNAPLLYVANVHLEAGMGSDDEATRFCQIQSLMNRLDKHIQIQSQSQAQPQRSSSSNAREPALVIMGDWNMRSDNPIYHLVSTGRLLDDDVNTKTTTPTTAISTKRRLRLPLPHLPLRDAYKLVPSHGISSTYAGGSILDYLWVSPSVQVQQLWSQPDSEHGRRQFWPNHLHPSDHLALGATLLLGDED